MNIIRVETVINTNIKRIWEMFTNPRHITKWYHATDDWECTYAKNELRADGVFVYRLTAKDKSASFNFMGKYKEIQKDKLIRYTISDRQKRQVLVQFERITDYETKVIEIFQPELQNPEGIQRMGWQGILDNFKKYVESNMDIVIEEEERWKG